MDDFGERKGTNIPPFVLCLIGGIMAGTLLASFTGLGHVADEMLWVGGAFGLIFYVSGMFTIAQAETTSSGAWG